MNTATMSSVGASEMASNKEEIEVTMFWGKALDKNALGQKHVALDKGIRIGETEGCDFSIPSEVTGTDSLDLVSFRGGEIVVTPPANAFVFVDRLPRQASPFVLARGSVVDIEMGAFSIRLSVGDAETKIPTDFGKRLEESAFGTIGFSAVAHAAFLAAFAFFMPSLSSADQEGIDRDQILMMKQYLTSAAEQEKETPPPIDGQASDSSSGSNAGQQAQGQEGSAGTSKPVSANGHWSAKGDASKEDVQLAKERAINEAREFGLIGLLASANASDSNAPVVPWGSTLIGADRESHLGNLWAGDMGDAFGSGLGLSGTGEGGGCTNGNCKGIGIDKIGNYGGVGTCPLGDDCTGGLGKDHGRVTGVHVSKGPRDPRIAEIKTNGRLDPAVIQRIVRQNSGRMVACYSDGLRTNPALAGRVETQFMIGRDGAVTMAQDASGSDMADMGVRQCVAKAYYNMTFPVPAVGVVTVVYPLVFSPTDQ